MNLQSPRLSQARNHLEWLRVLTCRVLFGAAVLAGCNASAHDDTVREPREIETHSEPRESRELHEMRESGGGERADQTARENAKSHGGSTSKQGGGGSSGRSAADDERSGSSENDEAEEREGSKDSIRSDTSTRLISDRIRVERDALGRERQSGEVLMIGGAQSVAAVRAAGYVVFGERQLSSFAETIARIRVGAGESVEQAMLAIQRLAPDAGVAPNHIYRPSVAEAGSAASQPLHATAAVKGSMLGVIDAGADPAWAGLGRAILRTQGFAAGGYAPRTHGTVVAEIAAAEGAQLEVADVFGTDDDNRLVAPAQAIAEAIDWLVAEGVPVINISIEGPDNLVLAHVIRRALAGNVAIVAAAGNGGPAAAPAYPAAYPGVTAVTAIDEQGQVYRRANRGDYIAFAARGVHIVSAYGAPLPRSLSGTSFAAPVVAAAIGRKLAAMHTRDVHAALAALQAEAIDLGATGRDPIYGWGEIR